MFIIRSQNVKIRCDIYPLFKKSSYSSSIAFLISFIYLKIFTFFNSCLFLLSISCLIYILTFLSLSFLRYICHSFSFLNNYCTFFKIFTKTDNFRLRKCLFLKHKMSKYHVVFTHYYKNLQTRVQLHS